jgi:hypothetical protein
MQYDTLRYAEFMVSEDIQGKNCVYEIETSQNKEVKGDCSISEDNVVSFLIPENITAKSGGYKGQLIFDDRLGSFPFLIRVTEAPHQSDDPYEVALSEVRQATQECIAATNELESIKSAAEDATSSANSAASAANSAADQWNEMKPSIDGKIQEMSNIINRFGDINPEDLVTPQELQTAINEVKQLINEMKLGSTDVMVEADNESA